MNASSFEAAFYARLARESSFEGLWAGFIELVQLAQAQLNADPLIVRYEAGPYPEVGETGLAITVSCVVPAEDDEPLTLGFGGYIEVPDRDLADYRCRLFASDDVQTARITLRLAEWLTRVPAQASFTCALEAPPSAVHLGPF